MIKEVKCYETTQGKVFNNLRDAVHAELAEYFVDNACIVDESRRLTDFCDMSPTNIADIILEKKDEITTLINRLKDLSPTTGQAYNLRELAKEIQQ